MVRFVKRLVWVILTVLIGAKGVGQPTPSHDRGYYEEPFQFTLSGIQPGETILFTTDGSLPSETDPRTQRYQGPVSVDRSVVGRYRGTQAEEESTPVQTRSFFFLKSILSQDEQPRGFPRSWRNQNSWYAMNREVVRNPNHEGDWKQAFDAIPSLSIVTPMENLFGPLGIYDFADRSGKS